MKKTALVLLSFAFIFLITVTCSQAKTDTYPPTTSLTLDAEYGVEYQDAEFWGDSVVTVSGHSITIFEIDSRNYLNPLWTQVVLDRPAHELQIIDNTAYILDVDANLYSFNLQTTPPQRLDKLSIGETSRRLIKNQTALFSLTLVDENNEYVISWININDPQSMNISNSLSIDSRFTHVDDIAASDSHLYVSSYKPLGFGGDNNLTVGAIPLITDKPLSIAAHTEAAEAELMLVHNNHLYVTGFSTVDSYPIPRESAAQSAANFFIYDLVNPLEPKLIRSLQLSSPNALIASGDFVYVTAKYDDQIFIVDVSAPDSAGIIVVSDLFSYEFALAANENYVLTGYSVGTTGHWLGLVGAAPSFGNSLTSYRPPQPEPEQLLMGEGNVVYCISEEGSTFTLYSIALNEGQFQSEHVTNWKRSSTVDFDLELFNNHIYTSADNRLFVTEIDEMNGWEFNENSDAEFTWAPGKLAVANGYLFSANDSVLQVYALDTPLAPTPVFSQSLGVNSTGTVIELLAHEDTLYTAISGPEEQLLIAIDVSNPLAPVEKARSVADEDTGVFTSLAYAGGSLFAGQQSGSSPNTKYYLSAWQVTDQAMIERVAKIQVSGWIRNVVGQPDGSLFVLDADGLSIYDPPSLPEFVKIGHYPALNYVPAALNGDYIATGAGSYSNRSIQVLRYSGALDNHMFLPTVSGR